MSQHPGLLIDLKSVFFPSIFLFHQYLHKYSSWNLVKWAQRNFKSRKDSGIHVGSCLKKCFVYNCYSTISQKTNEVQQRTRESISKISFEYPQAPTQIIIKPVRMFLLITEITNLTYFKNNFREGHCRYRKM